jgi:hypothetical protein
MGSNSIPINSPWQTPSNTATSAFISESHFLQCVPVVENHAVVVTIEEEEDKEGVSLAITQLKAKMAQTPEEAPSQTKTNPPTPPPPTNTIQLDIPDSKRTPTFHYESKAVTPDAAKCIYEVILLRSYSRSNGSEGLRPQLIRCAPFLSIAPYFRMLYISYPKIWMAIVAYPKVRTTII